VISSSQGRYLHTGQHKHRINAHTDTHALIGIRTHDPSVRASEDSSGHCDRLMQKSFIHPSMALQPFVGPWPLLQFRNHFYTDGRTPWTSDQPVARPLPIHRTAQTQNKYTHTDVHALSGIRTHDPSFGASEGSSCLRRRGHCDRLCKRIHTEIHKKVP
jgi:hypothetical protein